MLSRLMLTFIFALFAMPAHAQATGGLTLTQMLQNILNIFTGQTGQIIAVLAIVFTGVMMLFGALDRGHGVRVVVGIFLVFSGAWIVSQIVV